MASLTRPTRSTMRRQPLAEIRNQATRFVAERSSKLASTTPSPSPQPPPRPVLPHNESLESDGTLALRGGGGGGNNTAGSAEPPQRRVSGPPAEDSKRNSAISTASTGGASARPRKTYIGHWQLGRTIGKGGCSRVRVVRHKTTLQYGAVKIITRSTAESTRAQSLANLIESTKFSQPLHPGHRPIPYGLEREIAVMKLLEHPNIVRLYDVWENRNEL